MNFFPKYRFATDQDAELGSLAFFTNQDNRPAYGLIVQAQQDKRKCDFLSLETFKVWAAGYETGIRSFSLIEDVFAVTAESFAESVCSGTHNIPEGALVLGPNGPCIVASTGGRDEGRRVYVNVQSGEFEQDIYNMAYCLRWKILYATSGGWQCEILSIDPKKN